MSLRKCKLKQCDITTYPLECPKLRTLTTPNAGEEIEQRNYHSLLVGMHNDTVTLKDILAVSYKCKRTLTTQPSNHTPCNLLKAAENFYPHKNLHMDIYSSFLHNCQNLETSKMSFSR